MLLRKPFIGVIPLYDKKAGNSWMLDGYMDSVIAAGGIPLMLPLCSNEELLYQLSEDMDGFLFTGGQDINPGFYGQAKTDECGEIIPALDDLSFTLFRLALRRDKPILGICRGHQFINVALGGTLFQHIPNAEMHSKKNAVHKVEILRESKLFSNLENDRITVNSSHHQGIQTLAPTLRQTAISEDGLIEGVELPSARFVTGVQWHPELNFKNDVNSFRLISKFVSAAANRIK